MHEHRSRKIRGLKTMRTFIKLLLIAGITSLLYITGAAPVNAITSSTTGTIDSGYSVLKLLLEDEQHLTAIRRVKMVVTFSGINDASARLIDEISENSERSLDELEKLAEEKSGIILSDLSSDTIAVATLNSLRMTTAKEFLFAGDDFEKDLLISQLKVLPVIIHLAEQLEIKETNANRKKWLNQLAGQYEKHYQQINSRITLSAIEKS